MLTVFRISSCLFILFVLNWSCSEPESKTTIDREIAVSKLEQAAESEHFWVQVHAFEFLQKLGYNNWVDSSLQTFRRQNDTIPQRRIGVWRIGAKMNRGGTDSNPYLEKIKQVYSDNSATDRLHAAETLAKLGYSLNHFSEDVLSHDLGNMGDQMRAYVLWGKSLPVKSGQEIDYDLLLLEFGKDSPGLWEILAYGLTKTESGLDNEQWLEVFKLSNDESFSELTRHRLKLALLVNSENLGLSQNVSDELYNQVLTMLQSGERSIVYETCETLARVGEIDAIAPLTDIVKGNTKLDPEKSGKDSYKNNLDCQSAAAFALLAIDKRIDTGMMSADWIVVLGFILLMVGIGYYYSKRARNKEDYFLGGRSMNPVMVGLSLFATLLSTLSYLAYPGEMVKYGPMVFFGVLSFPLAYYIIGRFVIPQFMKLNASSAYEVLEVKLGSQVRDLGTVFFLLLRFLWMSTILYATVNTALIHIMGFEEAYVPWVCLLLAMITILYTTMGGIKAVVLTDAIQSGVLLGGAILTIVIISYDFGGFANWFPRQWMPHWESLTFGIDFNQRMTIGNIFLMTLVWQVCTSGSDQMAVQRYLSTQDVKAAKKTLKVSLWSSAIVQITLAVLGLAVASYFLKYPQSLDYGTTVYENADTLFPRFILIGLPPGVSGLVVAGLMAAAMSSLSSGLNSSSSVIMEDVVDRYFPRFLKMRKPLFKVRLITLVLGIAVTICSMFVGYIEGNLLDVVIKVVNLVVAPLFVLFFMALFVPGATEKGTIWGGLFSLLVAILIAFFGLFGLSVLTIMPVSLIVGIASSYLFSVLDRLKHKIEK